MEPSTEVGPVAADLNGASMKNDMAKCKHFSMRKYVSEMRQKDASKCWPFKLDFMLSEVPKDMFPTLDVPKYRWWKCPHCLPEFWVTATNTEDGAVTDDSRGKCKFEGPFADTLSLSETATLASDFQLMLNLDMADAEDSNLNVSSYINPKTSLLHVAVREDHNIQNHSQISKDVDPNQGMREPADKSATQGSNFKESLDFCYKGQGSLVAVNSENASKTVQTEKKAMDRKVTEVCENEGVGLFDDRVGRENGLGFSELNQHNSPSSDSAEVGPYKTGSSYKRKSRKVRLLTDLLATVENPSNKHIRKDNAPSLAICDASRELRKQSVVEGEMAGSENEKRVIVKRKRKLASEDFSKHSVDVCENREKENPSIFVGIAENGGAVLHSQLDDNGCTRMRSQSPMKNYLPEQVGDAKNSISKNKKKNQVTQKKSVSAETKYTVNSSNGEDVYSCKEVGTTLTPVPEIRKNTTLFKENHLPSIPSDQVPDMRRDISNSSGHPLARMDLRVGESNPASVQFLPAKPSHAVNGTHLTSKARPNASSKTDKPYISEVRQGRSFYWMEGVPKEGNLMKDNTDSRSLHVEPSFPFQGGLDAFLSNGVNGVINDGMDYRIPFHNDRERYSPNMLDTHCFWTPNVGRISGASKKKKIIKHNEQTAVKQPCRDKTAEPGNLDDIPMEIVELMAKHQYERCLQDAEMDKIPLSKTGNVWDSEIIKISKENKRWEQNLWLKENPQKRKLHPQKVSTSSEKPLDMSSYVNTNNYKVSQLERGHSPPVHHTFLQSQGRPPKLQTSGGPSNLSNTPNSIVNEDYCSIKASDGNFLSLGVSGPCYPPKHSEAPVSRLSSIRPDSMPFVYSIPQRCGLQSSSIDFQLHCPRTPPKVEMNWNRDPKIFSSRASSLQKPEDFHCEAYRGVNMEIPYISKLNGMEHEQRVASLDISSNETIPAMHLLSLMDAGMHSGQKIKLDENVGLSKQPSLPCEYHSKEVCGLHLGMCKTSIPLPRPSSDHVRAKILPGKYQELPVVPEFSSCASSSLADKVFRPRTTCVPLDVHEKGKEKCYGVGQSTAGSRVTPFITDNARLGTSYGFKPYHNTERNFPSSSEARIISPYQRTSEKETTEACNSINIMQPPRSSPDTAICTLNRNPAEFTVPEEGNVYSIGRDDLKLAKRVRKKPSPSNAHCHRGKKMAKPKHAAGINQTQPQIA